jgi:hypothetical protein
VVVHGVILIIIKENIMDNMTQKVIDVLGIGTFKRYPSTKRFDTDDAVETELTLDYSECTMEDIMAKAIKSDVISWQATYRNKKNPTIIVPATATYKVPKLGMRSTRTVPLTAENILAQYGSVDEAIKALQALKK